MQRYVKQYNEEYLEAEDRADKAFGSYIYIARKGVPRKHSNVISIEKCKDGWRVEYRWEPDEKIQKLLGLKFIRRGEL